MWYVFGLELALDLAYPIPNPYPRMLRVYTGEEGRSTLAPKTCVLEIDIL